MDNNKIGKFISKCRKEKGLTQKELGEKLFVTDKAISKWERGLSIPDVTILNKLAKELDVNIADILNGEKTKDDKIDIQKEVDKALNQIKESKRKKIKKILFSLVIVIASLSVLSIARYKYYHPNIIHKGNNHYELGSLGIYSLEKNGLDGLITIMNKTKGNDNTNNNVANLEINLSKNGNIKSFRMSINYFDKNLKYRGLGYYEYNSKSKKLSYDYKDGTTCEDVNDCILQKSIVETYSKTLNVRYLTNQYKRIPFKKQIKLSNLEFYNVTLVKNMKFDEKTNVFDMTNNKTIKPLKLDDYNKGKGGSVEPGIYNMIVLHSESAMVGKERYSYVFDNVDGDIKDLDNSMKTDYYIDGQNNLMFTRDYGKTWINTDISSDDVKDTLNFYRNNALLNGSWYVDENELVPIAYFYGKDAKLKISNDNGKTWIEKTLMPSDFKDITKRVVGFRNQNFGYAALGTDWSMGSGEEKEAFITNDGGKTWDKVNLPENNSSSTLMDYIMLDEKMGIVLLNDNENEEYPLMDVTTDGGKNWSKSEYQDSLYKKIDYISNIDSINKDNNEYTIVLSQGDSSTTKIKLKCKDLKVWNYDSKFNERVHTVG